MASNICSAPLQHDQNPGNVIPKESTLQPISITFPPSTRIHPSFQPQRSLHILRRGNGPVAEMADLRSARRGAG